MKLAYPPEYTKNRVAAYSPEYTKKQDSINCGILASGMGGSGDSKRKWEEKFHQQTAGAKNGDFALN